MAGFPAPAEGIVLTHLIVASLQTVFQGDLVGRGSGKHGGNRDGPARPALGEGDEYRHAA